MANINHKKSSSTLSPRTLLKAGLFRFMAKVKKLGNGFGWKTTARPLTWYYIKVKQGKHIIYLPIRNFPIVNWLNWLLRSSGAQYRILLTGQATIDGTRLKRKR